ncbi:MAG: metal-dependent transcriptional regulator [Oligoflexia bacterium]|nr:metal-dependent transcriptional regulator [Oligoflexia bacterium]
MNMNMNMNNLSEKHEEILEAIWVMAERKESSIESIRQKCVVDFSETDIEYIDSKGLIVRDGKRILFSKEGRIFTEKIIRRQRLAKVLLHSILKLRNSQMEELACKIEHTLLPEVEESICTLLGHPDVCPNGDPIPRGKCCGTMIDKVERVLMGLSELLPGESGKVAYIRPDNHAQLHQLISFGLNPGVIVTVHMTSPAFCIKFENTELALDDEIVKNIFVLKRKTFLK